ncbi:MAG: hypothetical protein AB1Z98_20015 [Nannocystaceae bacterium]
MNDDDPKRDAALAATIDPRQAERLGLMATIAPTAEPLAHAATIAPTAEPLAHAATIAPTAEPLAHAATIAPRPVELGNADTVYGETSPAPSGVGLEPTMMGLVSPTATATSARSSLGNEPTRLGLPSATYDPPPMAASTGGLAPSPTAVEPAPGLRPASSRAPLIVAVFGGLLILGVVGWLGSRSDDPEPTPASTNPAAPDEPANEPANEPTPQERAKTPVPPTPAAREGGVSKDGGGRSRPLRRAARRILR